MISARPRLHGFRYQFAAKDYPIAKFANIKLANIEVNYSHFCRVE